MEKRYGIPWFKINFIGANATAKSLRKIAAYFGDEDLIERVEKVIAEEMAEVEKVRLEVQISAARESWPCSSWAAPGPTTTRSSSRRSA